MDEIIAYYRRQGAPGDQSAVIALLREVQQHFGGSIPSWAPQAIAEQLGTKPGLLLALIRRIPSLRLSDTHILELCAGPSCGKCTALAACAEKLQKEAGYTLKYTGCMRQCGKGPNVRWDGKLYNGATEELLKELVKK